MHWTQDEKKLAQLRKSASSNGFDSDAAICTALGVPTVEAIPIGLGEALNKLARMAKERKSGSNGSTSTALVLSEDQHRALYQNEQQYQRGQAVRQVARWSETKDYRMTDQEIALVIMRGDAMGLDVFNPHEVQVWKDKHGVSFQVAYTLLAQWANEILGGHTQPRYEMLSDDEKKARGVAAHDFAMRCTFIMNRDFTMFTEMLKMGMAQEAKDMFTRSGVGVVTAEQWGQKGFAPNGRSRLWKLQKRAYTDAIRTNFGEPGKPDILKLRQERGEENIQPQDWQVTSCSNQEATLVEAKYNADLREPIEHVSAKQAITELFDELDATEPTTEPQPDSEPEYIEIPEKEPLRKIEHPADEPPPNSGMTLLKANNTKFCIPSTKRPELQGKILSEVLRAAPEIIKYLASDEYKPSSPNTITLKEAATFLVQHHAAQA